MAMSKTKHYTGVSGG